MDEIQKIIDIRVKYSDAIEGISRLNGEMDKLKVEQMKLNAEMKSGTITQEEYGKETAAVQAAMRSYKEEVRTLNKEIDNNIRQEKANEGSLAALRSQLSNLTKEYDNLSRAERNGAKGQELQRHLVAVTDELKSAEEETKRFYRNVGNYNGAVKPMRQELKELTMQLAQMERDGLRGSEAYNEMAKRAGAMRDNIHDATAEIKRYASDTRMLDDVVDVVSTAGAAWQTYQGAVQAFGIESEEAMQAMAKLQGVMATVNGLQQLHARFTDNSTATYKIFHKVLQLVGLEEKAVAASTVAMTTATQANTAAEGANATASATTTTAKTAEAAATTATTVAMTGASVAAKVLRAALLTIGIGAVVAALGALVAYWDDVKEFFGGMTEEEKRLQERQEKLTEAYYEGAKAYAKAQAQMDMYRQRIEEFNGTKRQEQVLVDELNKVYGDSIGKYKTLDEWKAQLDARGKAYIETMMLEAEAQAILNQYIEAYGAYVKTMRADAGEFGSWYTSDYTDRERKAKAVEAARGEADAYLKEYTAKMKEADKKRKQFQLGQYSPTVKTSSPTKTSSKTTGDTEAERLKRENEEIRKAEDLLRELISDNLKQRRADINAEYDRQIEDIRIKIKERKNLTVKEEEALTSQLVTLEKLRQKELSDVDAEAEEERIVIAQERITRLLEATKDDALKQRQLRLEQLDNEEQLERQQIEREVTNEEQRESLLLALQLQYQQKRKEVEENFNQQLAEETARRIQEEYDTRILQTDSEVERLRLEAEKRHELMLEAQQQEGETIEAFNLRKLQMQEEYNEAKKALDDKEVEIEAAKYTAIANLIGGLGQVADAFSEDSKTLAKVAKVLALGEIAVNTGVALAKGIKEAQSVPYPANIAAIATTVGTILANIATAIKTVKSAKFATGGIVRGAGTATSDSIEARLSNGESVMTERATSMFSPILSAFNQLGGGVPIINQSPQQQMGEDMLAAAVAKGVMAMPSPVVSVEEINNVGRRVQVIENLSTI